MDDDQVAEDVETEHNLRRPCQSGDVMYITVADDQYCIAATPYLTYMISELAKKMKTIGQHFNASKSEYIDTDPDDDVPTFWTDKRLEHEQAKMTHRRGESRLQVTVCGRQRKRSKTGTAATDAIQHDPDNQGAATGQEPELQAGSAAPASQHPSSRHSTKSSCEAEVVAAINRSDPSSAGKETEPPSAAAQQPLIWEARACAAAPSEAQLSRQCAIPVPLVDSMTIMGSHTVVPGPGAMAVAIAHRRRAAWRAWSEVAPQVKQRSAPLALRLQLLDEAVLPLLLWGLECLNLNKTLRRGLTGLQLEMVKRTMQLLRRPSEELQDFWTRREKLAGQAMSKFTRAQWGDIQRYRHINFLGHVARLPEWRYSNRALNWRCLRWWARYRSRLPPKMGGQAGRRKRIGDVPCRNERGAAEAFKTLCESPATADDMLAMLSPFVAGHSVWPVDWMHLAQDKYLYREFSRWTAFRRQL